MDRRDFIKTLGVTGLAVFSTKSLAQSNGKKKEMNAILVDTTLCAGCRSCEFACAEYHNFPIPDEDEAVLEKQRKTTTEQYTLINKFEPEDGEIYVKQNCMHCVQPACAAACLTKAMIKTPEGPVIWREDKCMGCRYCMISCPFDQPKFEYQSANPKVLKCNMCYERTSLGKLPICVEACPSEAIIFGKRKELLHEARRRIYQNPENYVHHIYGEDEAGGTSIIYLAGIDFGEIGFKQNIDTEAYPKLTTEFLYSVPVIETLLPPFLVALSYAAKKKAENKIEEGEKDEY